jgi:hypothetical protein
MSEKRQGVTDPGRLGANNDICPQLGFDSGISHKIITINWFDVVLKIGHAVSVCDIL